MGIYMDLKKKHQKEFNEFTMFFAFNNEQLKNGLKKLKVTEKDLVSIGYGGFIKKSSKQAFFAMLNRHRRECKRNYYNETYLYEMFYYELGNHEYIVTGDLTDTLEACQLNPKEVNDNPLMGKALLKAMDDYLKGYQE